MGHLDTSLLVEQPLVYRLAWIGKSMTVALFVRFDLAHVELSWRHGRQERIELVEVALARCHT
jgi:hypothetical protein